MGLFSYLSVWGGERGKINDSDKSIHVLTGINPKHLHPELYKNNITLPHEVTQGLVPNDDYGRPDLTPDEITALRLAMLLLIYDKHEEYPLAQKCADGLGRLMRTRSHAIRGVISNIINNDICHNVRTQDSNPEGLPGHPPENSHAQNAQQNPQLVIREIDRRGQSTDHPQPVAPPPKPAPPAFNSAPKTVLSAEDRQIIADLKLAGWTVMFNGKSWTFRNGDTVRELFDAEELRIFANKSRK